MKFRYLTQLLPFLTLFSSSAPALTISQVATFDRLLSPDGDPTPEALKYWLLADRLVDPSFLEDKHGEPGLPTLVISKVAKAGKALRPRVPSSGVIIRKLGETEIGQAQPTTDIFAVDVSVKGTLERLFVVKASEEGSKEVRALASFKRRLEASKRAKRNARKFGVAWPSFAHLESTVCYHVDTVSESDDGSPVEDGEGKAEKKYGDVDAKDEVCVLLLQAARGEPAEESLKPEVSDPEAKLIIRRVATAIGNMHRYGSGVALRSYFDLLTDFAHGDLHLGNVFYDPVTQRVTLIDNMNFGEGLAMEDFSRLLAPLLDEAREIGKSIDDSMPNFKRARHGLGKAGIKLQVRQKTWRHERIMSVMYEAIDAYANVFTSLHSEVIRDHFLGVYYQGEFIRFKEEIRPKLMRCGISS